MEVSHLRTLRELRDRGSIAAVAAAMHVTPSSVSQQLALLQRKTGVQLTKLDGRRTVLTEAGLALAAAAVDVETSLARARRTVEEFGRTAAPVTMSAFLSAAQAFGPPLLSAHRRDSVPIHLADEDVSKEAFPPLTTKYDLVIAHRMAGSEPWPQTVAVTHLFSEPMDVAFRVGHRLDGLPKVGPDDLAGAKWIAVHGGFPLEVAVRTAAAAAGEDAHIIHRINDFGVAAALVASTDHIALLPRYLWTRTPGVRLAPVADVGYNLSRRIDVLCRPEVLERRGVQAILKRLKQLGRDASARG